MPLNSNELHTNHDMVARDIGCFVDSHGAIGYVFVQEKAIEPQQMLTNEVVAFCLVLVCCLGSLVTQPQDSMPAYLWLCGR